MFFFPENRFFLKYKIRDNIAPELEIFNSQFRKILIPNTVIAPPDPAFGD